MIIIDISRAGKLFEGTLWGKFNSFKYVSSNGKICIN